MTYLRVLTIVLLAAIAVSESSAFTIAIEASVNVDGAKGRMNNADSICASAQHFNSDGNTVDMFCMGVKDGKVDFPEGTGCLKDGNCDYIVAAKSVTKRSAVQWFLISQIPVSKMLLVLSHVNTSTSKKDETYRLPANVVALEGKATSNQTESYSLRMTDHYGQEVISSDDCFKLLDLNSVPAGFTSSQQVDCRSNGFRADLYKDELYATIVVTKGSLDEVYHLSAPVVMLGRGAMSAWAVVAVIIGFIAFLVLVCAICIGGCIYWCCPRNKRRPYATATHGLYGQSYGSMAKDHM